MGCHSTCGPKTTVTVWCRGQKPTYCDSNKEAELFMYGNPHHAMRRCSTERGCVTPVVFAGRRKAMSKKTSFGYTQRRGQPSRGMPGYAVTCKGDDKPRVFPTWNDALFYSRMMGGKCKVRAATPRDLAGLRRRRSRKPLGGCGCGG